MVATQIFFIFIPKIGEDEPIFDSYFSNGLVQPPTNLVFFFPMQSCWNQERSREIPPVEVGDIDIRGRRVTWAAWEVVGVVSWKKTRGNY